MGITSGDVIELPQLTTQLKSMAMSWLFELDTRNTIPKSLCGPNAPVYIHAMLNETGCMMCAAPATAESRYNRSQGGGRTLYLEWMKEHRATSSIVKMRIGLQGDALTGGFCHLLLIPRSLDVGILGIGYTSAQCADVRYDARDLVVMFWGMYPYVFVAGPKKHDVFTRVSDLAETLTVFAASNVILKLTTSADELLHQHKPTLSALSFYCSNRRPGSTLTPIVGSTFWFTQFPVLRQLCLRTSHICALHGFYTTPNFLRMMIHSPIARLLLKGLWPPERHGVLYQSVLDLIQTRTITSTLIIWTSPLHDDDVTDFLPACRKHDIELVFWPCKDQHSCIA